MAMTALCILVDRKLSERTEALGETFRSEIAALKSPLVQQVRSKGLLNTVVIDKASNARGRTAWQFCLFLESCGVLAKKPTHEYVIVSEKDLRKGVNMIAKCLNDLDRLDDIPGEVKSEKGHKDMLTN
ncbi:hypothetical protein SCLCIDRAFT_33961 [Scleroderma citrinum Foug A]|uniref:Uncharacterized protein n=1 Tax=Scleroderma citrinum Foug A TaxID=1036808 RepID=A0A0C3D3X6_9AGAM|nr:hypothetical protein SCLCIDRAFT_33961 [Scleroderma citrinum Foug A]